MPTSANEIIFVEISLSGILLGIVLLSQTISHCKQTEEASKGKAVKSLPHPPSTDVGNMATRLDDCGDEGVWHSQRPPSERADILDDSNEEFPKAKADRGIAHCFGWSRRIIIVSHRRAPMMSPGMSNANM
jgi:hypothetical protein